MVTVNSQTGQIPGVKDPAGVQNVAKFHEAVHVDRDLSALKTGPQFTLQGFETPPKIVCYRRPEGRRAASNRLFDPNIDRESWAEQAGRAAAVSYEVLFRSDAFRAFIRLRQSGTAAANGERWRLLYQAAEDIGVNSSALVKQLELDGQIVVQKEGGRQVIHPQPGFLTLMEGR